jgi:hypothetical protein
MPKELKGGGGKDAAAIKYFCEEKKNNKVIKYCFWRGGQLFADFQLSWALF